METIEELKLEIEPREKDFYIGVNFYDGSLPYVSIWNNKEAVNGYEIIYKNGAVA